MTQQIEKKTYEVLKAGPNMRIAGLRREVGDRLELSESEAQFLVLDGVIAEVAPAPAKKKNGGE